MDLERVIDRVLDVDEPAPAQGHGIHVTAGVVVGVRPLERPARVRIRWARVDRQVDLVVVEPTLGVVVVKERRTVRAETRVEGPVVTLRRAWR